jgi:hypothetical protein
MKQLLHMCSLHSRSNPSTDDPLTGIIWRARRKLLACYYPNLLWPWSPQTHILQLNSVQGLCPAQVQWNRRLRNSRNCRDTNSKHGNLVPALLRWAHFAQGMTCETTYSACWLWFGIEKAIRNKSQRRNRRMRTLNFILRPAKLKSEDTVKFSWKEGTSNHRPQVTSLCNQCPLKMRKKMNW